MVLRLRPVALRNAEDGEVVERCSYERVVAPQRLLLDRQRPAVGFERRRVATLGLVHEAETEEASGYVGVVGTQRLLLDRQRPAVGPERRRVAALGKVHVG